MTFAKIRTARAMVFFACVGHINRSALRLDFTSILRASALAGIAGLRGGCCFSLGVALIVSRGSTRGFSGLIACFFTFGIDSVFAFIVSGGIAFVVCSLGRGRCFRKGGGVAFFCDVRHALKACLWSRLASRIMLVVGRVDARIAGIIARSITGAQKEHDKKCQRRKQCDSRIFGRDAICYFLAELYDFFDKGIWWGRRWSGLCLWGGDFVWGFLLFVLSFQQSVHSMIPLSLKRCQFALERSNLRITGIYSGIIFVIRLINGSLCGISIA